MPRDLSEPMQATDTHRVPFTDKIAGLLSVLAVATMLCGASVVLADVLSRWLLNQPIFALNEIMSQVFAVAVALTIPAGALRGVNLRVDLLAAHMSPRLSAWLVAIGGLLLAGFFAVLTWRIWGLAVRYDGQERGTLLLSWPLAPTYYVVAVAFATATLIQLGKTAALVRRAWGTASGVSRPIVLGMVALLLVTVGGLGAWTLADVQGLMASVAANPGLYVVVGFLLVWLCAMAQFEIAAITGLIGLFGAAAFLGQRGAGNSMASDAMDFLTNAQVATLPLFLLMGAFAVAAGVSQDIYRVASAVLGQVRAGLAYATVAACAGFGAISGSSVATAATFGQIALPEMKRRGYAPSLASGTVAAGGTLGALVPPSGSIILFALLTEQSIGVLFVASMIPALLALVLYFGAIYATVKLRPGQAPEVETTGERTALGPALLAASPVIVLFAVVIGGLYGGVMTATESAAVGAIGAFLLALFRGNLNRATVLSVMSRTTDTTALIYGLIFGAMAFSFFVTLGQAPELVSQWITGLDLTPLLVLVGLLVFYLALGSVMDSFAVMVITVPIVTPIVTGMGYDIIFWGILMLFVVETGLITPPFGLNLFVIKSMQPDQPITRVMGGVIPFVLADVVKIALLVAFPALALWLPSTMH